jgi:hypothetical protein
MTSKQVKWNWTKEHQSSFDTMKRILSREVLLSYPDFNETFHIHTDASHTQLGAVISQNGKPIAFYSRKLNPAQPRYTTTERELLSIVEMIKEFRIILLGQKLVVHTDHKNLTYTKHNTERVMRWRLLIEEYGPELRYIKGTNNVVADALSRLANPAATPTAHLTPEEEAETFAYDKEDLPSDFHPLRYRDISKAQNADKALLEKMQQKKADYTLQAYHGGGKSQDLITFKDKIVIPTALRSRVVE